MRAPILETRSVIRAFGGLVANRDVSIAVADGELVGLIGPNGAGKSTLFNLIAGAFPPTAGTILFEGRAIEACSAAERCRRGIARTFQVPRSFESMSAIENVTVGALVRHPGLRAARRAAYEVLDDLGLGDRADAPATDLTPPEKRRLEMARALATDPKLLLLDEVLTGLTPAEAKAGVEIVRRVRARGVTIIMVEHVMEIVMPLVDRVIVLDLGAVLTQGRPADVVQDSRVIAAYFGERRRAS